MRVRWSSLVKKAIGTRQLKLRKYCVSFFFLLYVIFLLLLNCYESFLNYFKYRYWVILYDFSQKTTFFISSLFICFRSQYLAYYEILREGFLFTHTHTQNDIVIFWGRQSVLALLVRTQNFSNNLSSNLTKLG